MYTLFLFESESKTLQQVTQTRGRSIWSWSPDGRKLAFTAEKYGDEAGNSYLMEVERGTRELLIGESAFAIWSGESGDLTGLWQYHYEALTIHVMEPLQNTDPQFQGGWQNNGGPTQTIALPATSPAVNKIPVNSGPGCVTGGTDQRGYPRPDHFLLLLPESTCDIGAYKVQGELLQ